MLAPVLALVENPQQNPDAFLAARYLVAFIGVATAALAYALGRRLFGTATGLLAAALLAVSPLEVRVAHEVRPDIVLEAIVLLGFFAFRRVGEGPAGDVLSGVAIGAATAVKFSGALMAPSYVVARFVAPGSKLRRIALAALVSLIAFAVLSPYTFLRGASVGPGHGRSVELPLRRAGGGPGTVGNGGRVRDDAGGGPGTCRPCSLALAGLVVGRARWREWLPLLVLPLVTLAVFSTATITQDRFLIPTLGVTALLSGPAVEAPGRAQTPSACGPWRPWSSSSRSCPRSNTSGRSRGRSPRTSPPTGSSLTPPRGASSRRPTRRSASTRTASKPWSSECPAREPASRPCKRTWWSPDPTNDRAGIVGLTKLFVAEPETRYSGERIRVFAVPAELRPRYRAVDLSEARLTSSEAPEHLVRIHDGDAGTAWRTTEAQAPRRVDPDRLCRARASWDVSRSFRRPTRTRWPTRSSSSPPRGRRELERAPFLPGRPTLSQQRGAPSQVLLLPEVRAITFRLVQVGRKTKPWGIAELRLEALD